MAVAGHHWGLCCIMGTVHGDRSYLGAALYVTVVLLEAVLYLPVTLVIVRPPPPGSGGT